MSWLERAPRTSAVVFGAGLLVAVELVLRAVGVGDFRDRPDPFAGFSRLHPSFVLAPPGDGPRRMVAIDGARPTRDFIAEKPANGFRVFVLGGSTEAGTPYGYEFAFAALLERQLAAALPHRRVEVINCAVPGYASRRLLYLAEEVARYQPDLFIVSTGHNELIEQRVYAHLFDSPVWLFELRMRLRALRSMVLLEDLLRLVRSPSTPQLDTEKIYLPMFGTRIDKGLWSDEQRDPEDQRYFALAMFRNNVDRILRIARSAGAEVLLLTQSKNYADWPIAHSAHALGLSGAELEEWERTIARAGPARESGDAVAELRILEKAAAIDPRYASTQQRLADLYRAAGRFDEARAAYRRAQNQTLDHFGTTPARNDVIAELAAKRAVLWLDVERLFEEASPHGLVGDNFFTDFLHPNLAGHQLLATAIFATLREAGVPAPADRWRRPPPLPDPRAQLVRLPRLRAQELRTRILAELLSDRPEKAALIFAELERLDPDAEDLPQIAEWIEEGPPEGR